MSKTQTPLNASEKSETYETKQFISACLTSNYYDFDTYFNQADHQARNNVCIRSAALRGDTVFVKKLLPTTNIYVNDHEVLKKSIKSHQYKNPEIVELILPFYTDKKYQDLLNNLFMLIPLSSFFIEDFLNLKNLTPFISQDILISKISKASQLRDKRSFLHMLNFLKNENFEKMDSEFTRLGINNCSFYDNYIIFRSQKEKELLHLNLKNNLSENKKEHKCKI